MPEREAAEPESAVAEPAVERPGLPAFGYEPDLVGRMLMLQRTAGNRAARALLQRQPTAVAEPDVDPFAPGKKVEPRKVAVKDLKFACIFVAHDLYGTQARRFARTFLQDHTMIEAGSMEDAMVKMAALAQQGEGPKRIAEIVLVAHGNKEGFLKMPLVAGRKGTTAREIAQLQGEFQSGGRARFRGARDQIIPLLDDGSSVIVRGCRAGRIPELVDAMSAFFGGQASVYIPTELQAFTRLRIGGSVIKNEVEAFDHLVMQGFVPKEPVATDEDKVRWVKRNLPDGFVPEQYFVTEKHEKEVRGAKTAEAVSKDAKDYAGARMEGMEHWGVKAGAHDSSSDAALDTWPADRILATARQHLAKLRTLEATRPDDWKAIGEEAWWVMRCHHAYTRRPEAAEAAIASPDPMAGVTMPGLNYDTNVLAGQAASRPDLRTPHVDAFSTAKLTVPQSDPPAEIEGMGVAETPAPPEEDIYEGLDGPGPARAGAASGRGAPARPAEPPLSAAELTRRGQELLDAIAKEESKEEPDVREIAKKAREMLALHENWSSGKGIDAALEDKSGDPLGGFYIPGLSYDLNLLAMQAAMKPRPRPAPGATPAKAKAEDPGPIPDVITPTPSMPEPTVIYPPTSTEDKPEVALVVRGEFKKPFEIPFEKSLWILKVKKAVVDFNGKIDFKGEGKREVVIGAFGALQSKPGEAGKAGGESARAGGEKLEGTIWKGEDKGTGISGSVKGGAELGGIGRTKLDEGGDPKGGSAGMKAEVYLTGAVGWGPISTQLKVVVIGMDESKGTFTILGLKWSPIVATGEFELPVVDGTKVKFTGTIAVTIEAEPDWPKVAATVGRWLGRTAAVEAGAVAAGGAAAGGTAAAAAGGGAAETGAAAAGGVMAAEAIIATGFLAAGFAVIYAYYKSAQEIEDLKELQRASGEGVADFVSGYLNHLGIKHPGGPGGPLRAEGARHAEIQLKARCKRAAHFLNERAQKQMFNEDDADLREAILGGIQRDADSWRAAVQFSYSTAIRTRFYKAWLEKVKGTDQERNALNARARAGLSSVDLQDQPDYSWVNAVGSRGAVGMKRPDR